MAGADYKNEWVEKEDRSEPTVVEKSYFNKFYKTLIHVSMLVRLILGSP